MAVIQIQEQAPDQAPDNKPVEINRDCFRDVTDPTDDPESESDLTYVIVMENDVLLIEPLRSLPTY